jgi:6-phosphogluconolactonase
MHTFHILLPMAALAAPLDAVGDAPAYWRVYIGTYTQGASDGIYLLRFDPQSGHLELLGLAAEVENPSFLALHPDKPLLYAVGEFGRGTENAQGAVSAFAIAPDTGMLALVNRASPVGAGPCHVAVAPSGRHVAVANYGGGSVALLPLDSDGALEEASAFAQHEGRSVNPRRQEGPHAHSVTFDPTGAYLFVADLGIDKLLVYRYDADTGDLAPHDPPHSAVAPGAGPRHFAFHPSGRFAYVVNELGNTVTAFGYDATAGRLEELHSVGTLPAGFTGENTTAEIRVHPTGRFLYASNRGHDSIASFGIDAETGRLTETGHTPTGGKTPRNFHVDPTGRFLLAANQGSDSVVVFRIDEDGGTLEPTGDSVEVPSPVCVVFMRP